MRKRPKIVHALLVAALLGASVAAAQGQRLLHEFFTYTDSDAVPVDGELGGLDAPGRIGDGDAMLGDGPMTTSDGLSTPDLPPGLFADPLRNGPLRPESSELLDDETEREGMLQYQEVFDPSIAPFKRAVARDEVNSADDIGADIPMMRVLDPSRVRVPVGVDAVPPDWIRFRGEIRMEAAAGESIPLPSPAPDGILIGAFTDPPVAISFERDGADNWYVIPATSGVHRLVWDVAAPASYFGGPLPEGETWDGTTTGRFFEEAPTVAREIGIRPGQSQRAIVSQLTAWFRGFTGGAIRRSMLGYDSLYLDIALGRVGVCRHRSIAFVVTAQALGIESRYVHNEAHAFVEVRIAGIWRRIDLGGDAEGLDVIGGGEPLQAAGDTLPTTPEYEAQQQRMDNRTTRRAPSGPPSSREGSAGDGIGDGPSPWDEPSAEGSAFADDTRTDTVVELELLDARAFRGEPMRVAGRLLTADGEPLGDRRIVFWIGPQHRGAAGAALRVGDASTAQDGRYTAELRVPPTAPLGRGGLFAVFDGDTTFRGAVSR
jgi:hypothetical protein